jgi:hypothetical protein
MTTYDYEERLTPLLLFRQAWSTFKARWKRVLGLGAVVSAVAITSDSLLDILIEHHRDTATGIALFVVVMVSIAFTAANGLGTTFLSGVLDRTVGEHQHGHPAESLWQLLGRIPYGWLILADILTIIIKVVGFILLVIPGFIAITLMCIVGPVVMIEKRRPFSAVRRSAQLVWPCFWLTFVAVTVPILGESMLTDLVESAEWAHGFLRHLTVGVVIEAPIAIFVSLVEVTLAYHLMERDRPGQIAAEAHRGSE